MMFRPAWQMIPVRGRLLFMVALIISRSGLVAIHSQLAKALLPKRRKNYAPVMASQPSNPTVTLQRMRQNAVRGKRRLTNMAVRPGSAQQCRPFSIAS
jgi:hypothetical protein